MMSSQFSLKNLLLHPWLKLVPRSLALLILLATLASFNTSCSSTDSIGPEFPLEKDQFVNLPDSEPYQGNELWWEVFQSKQLNRLMQIAFQKNRSIKIAALKIDQAKAKHNSIDDSGGPELHLGASRGATLSQVSSTDEDSGEETTTIQTDQYSQYLQFSYDLDPFGARRGQVSAAEMEMLSAIEEYKTVIIQTAQLVTKAWLQWLGQKSEIVLLDKAIAADQQNLNMSMERFRLGTATASDVQQARTQLASSKSQVAVTRSNLVRTNNRLSMLLGRYPMPLDDESQKFPELTLPPIVAGLPSSLIKRRSDIRTELLKIKASDARVSAALAARFPQFRITSSFTSSNADVAQLSNPENWVLNLLANLTMPIFDFGKRRADVEYARKILEERMIHYQNTLYQAFNEVEENLELIKLKEEHVAALKELHEISEQSLQLSREYYRQGLETLFQVLTIQKQVFSAEKSLLIAKRELFELRVDLYSALGGSWPSKVITDESPKEDSLKEDGPKEDRLKK